MSCTETLAANIPRQDARRLKFHRRFAFQQIARVGFHRSKFPCSASVVEICVIRSSRVPRSHRLLGLTHINSRRGQSHRDVGFGGWISM